MVVKGLISFGVGGAFLLLALTEIFASLTSYYYNPYQLTLQSAILGFLSFLLIGLGLYLLVKEAKQEKQESAPAPQ